MIISHEHRFIFIHILKTGGESVTAALEPTLGRHDIVLKSESDIWLKSLLHSRYRELDGLRKHSTARAVQAALPEQIWRDYFTFTFVRDPVDRAVSLYKYIAMVSDRRDRRRLRHLWYRTTQRGRNADPAAWRVTKAFRETNSFSEFIRHPDCATATGMRPQVSFVTDRKGRMLLDYVGKLEHLDHDFADVTAQLGLHVGPLPRVNVSRVSEPRIAHIEVTDDDRTLLRARYRRDIEMFGYGSGQTVN